MKFEIKPFAALFESGEFQEMFEEAFGCTYAKKLASSYDEFKPEEIGLLFDNSTKVSFFSFKREKDFVFLIELGYLQAAAKHLRYSYFISIVEALHELGFQDVGTCLPVIDRRGIINCLSIGFDIIGCRQTERNLQVQLDHSATNFIPSKSIYLKTNFTANGIMH